MAIPDAQTVAQKWSQRAGAAAQDYAAGVASTDKDPTALAIAQQARLRNKVLEAIDSGKWANNLRKTGKTGWQNAVASKGVANYSNGVSSAVDTVAAAFAPLLAFEAGLQRTIQSMPNTTDADKDARALAWIRGMRNYQGA